VTESKTTFDYLKCVKLVKIRMWIGIVLIYVNPQQIGLVGWRALGECVLYAACGWIQMYKIYISKSHT
jgi:hypothetical protein